MRAPLCAGWTTAVFIKGGISLRNRRTKARAGGGTDAAAGREGGRRMKTMGIDIGGTSFRIGIADESNALIRFDKVPTRSVFSSGNVLKDLSDYLVSFSRGIAVDAAAVGFPATLNAGRTRVLQAPNVPFMENLPVCETLRKEMKIPVYAERDVTFALFYDTEKYRIPPEGLTCGIYFGTGIGNAMLLNGKPVAGRHGTAGELGHIPVRGSHIPCGCGNAGCLEAVAGGKAIARLQREKFPETPIGDMFAEHGKDPDLLDIVRGMAHAVATEVNILDPDYLLLGGGVLSMKAFPRQTLEEMIREHARKPWPCDDLAICYTEDDPDKSVIGGAVFARRKLGFAGAAAT